MEICRLEHVKKEYRMGETVCPLKDVNMSVNSGDFIAVEELLAEAAQKGAGVVMVTHNSRWTAAAALKDKMQNRELIKI